MVFTDAGAYDGYFDRGFHKSDFENSDDWSGSRGNGRTRRLVGFVGDIVANRRPDFEIHCGESELVCMRGWGVCM